MGFDSILVELDASAVINLFLLPPDHSPILNPIITECRMLARSFRRIQVRHIYREANGVADFLAKIARDDCNEYRLLDRPPPGVGGYFCSMQWEVILLDLLAEMLGMPSLLTCNLRLLMK